MSGLFFAVLGHNQLWYMFPLIVTISLVYGATRHEHLLPILDQSVRFGAWIIGFMLMIYCVFATISWWT